MFKINDRTYIKYFFMMLNNSKICIFPHFFSSIKFIKADFMHKPIQKKSNNCAQKNSFAF